MREKAKELFGRMNVDCLLIRSPDPFFHYFSQMHGSSFEHDCLIVEKNQTILLTSFLDYATAKKQFKGKIIQAVKRDDREKQLRAACKKFKSVGVNYSALTVNGLKRLRKRLPGKRFIDCSKALMDLTDTKTRDEIKKIRKSCEINSEVMQMIPDIFRKGMTENALALKIEFLMRELGAEELAFPVIAASGLNSAVPHHVTSDKKIRDGKLLLLDFGCKYKRYCSDFTRTFVVGKPNPKQQELHETVLNAQNECLKLIKPDAIGHGLQKKADAIFMEKYHAPMTHLIGHGLGIQIHEFSYAAQKPAKRFNEGMVFTVEPGFYLPKVGGIRIEDTIQITKKGFISLTNAPKELMRL